MEKEQRQKRNPLKYCRQHDKQKEAAASRAMIRALFWGNRVGKTEWGAQEVAKVALGEHGWIQPGEIWSFSPSFDEQKDTTQKKLLSYIPEDRIIDRSWIRKGILKEIVIDASNGRVSKIAFKSYEQGREKAQGAGKVLIWFDEEPPKDIFDECSVRQEAGIELYMILTMTPVKGMTWVYNEIYLNTSNPDLFVSEASWNDNPFLLESQKEQMRRRLNKNALLVREQGKFMKQVGLVCSWFTRSVHVVEMTELPPGDTFFALDFGFSNPAAGLWVRIDREFNWWVFDGFYRKGLTNPDIQSIVRLKEQGLGRGHSCRRFSPSQRHQAALRLGHQDRRRGQRARNKTRELGRVACRASRAAGPNPRRHGQTKALISSKLVDLDDDGNEFNFVVREAENLRWEETKTDLGIEQKAVWGKQPNHAIDALSYLAAKIHGPISSNPIRCPSRV